MRRLARPLPTAVLALAAAPFLAIGCAPVAVRHANLGPKVLAAPEVRSDLGMVASGSVEATRAGVEILERGGNAVDAAVAVALALGSAEPGGSGLGGMTYLLAVMADGRAVAIDGTSPAPLEVDPARLQELREADRLEGLATAAVPGTLAALLHALDRFGTMTRAEVLEPAIEIAESGYRLSPHQITWLETYLEQILRSDSLPHLVLDGGSRVGRPGDRYCNPELAATLRRIAEEGVDAFYRGSISRQIEADMKRHHGFVRRADLALLRVRELEPVRTRYRDVEVIAFPLPGGGAATAEALNILETFPSERLDHDSVDRLQLLVEAFRIAHADHRRFSPDPNRLPAPGGLPSLDKRHARARAALIVPGQAIPSALLAPPTRRRSLDDNTSHVSVADRYGNAVALTQTLGRQYGGKAATPGLGFPYNCLLEWFDFEDPSSPAYLRARGRCFTDMTPAIVRRNGELVAVLGGAGSERIPQTVALLISNLVDRGMGLREAVLAPRVLWSGPDPEKPYLEIAPPVSEADADALEGMGFPEVYRLRFPPRPIDLTFFGGVNGVTYDPTTGRFAGVGDPRRHGFALGPRTVARPR